MKTNDKPTTLEIPHRYLRWRKMFPNVLCPGCGHGTALGGILRAIDELEIPKDDVVFISGIGCSGRVTTYTDFNTLHTTHGRPIAFATGVKLANPKLHVIVVSGDGDALAIGGNHLIHACRRNIDITYIILNNKIYGMTGGQYSPSTPAMEKGSTAPYGNLEPNFDIPALTMGAGATYVARGTSYHVVQLQKILKDAIMNHGFSVVEVLTQCPTYYGRINRKGGPVEMLDYFKEACTPISSWEKLSPEEKTDKIPIGVFRNEPKEEYNDRYNKLITQMLGEQS